MLNTEINDVFEEISDTESSTVSGGFWSVALPIAAVVVSSIYLSIKHKGVVVGYDSKIADGTQQYVPKPSRPRKKFLGLF